MVPRVRPQQSGSSMIIGIISAVLSSMCQSIGLILQRKSHLNYADSSKHYKPPYKRSMWRTGFLLFLISNVFGSSIQITTLPLIILSPLQSIGLVFNSLFSSLLLNEVFTQNSLIGTVLIGLGALLIAIFGRIPEPEYNLDQFISFLQRRDFVIWCSLNVLLVIALLLWITLSLNSDLLIKSHQPAHIQIDQDSIVLDNDNYIDSTTSNEYEHFQQAQTQSSFQGWILSCKSYTIQIITNFNHTLYKTMFDFSPKTSSLLQGIFFGWISGTLSGFSLLLAKSTIEILVNCITSKSFHSIFAKPIIWIIILSFLTLCLSQLWFLNQGLKLITTSILYPLVFCIYNIVNIGNELIFFSQWQVVTMWQLFNICIGTSLVFAGVLFLSWRLDDHDDHHHLHRHLESTPLLKLNPHFHHQRNFSLENNTPMKRVGLSSILHINNNNNNTQDIDAESTPKSTPVLKSFFYPSNNNNSINNTNSPKTPVRNHRSRTLVLNTSLDPENDEGLSEYISFGSPNNKYSPPSSSLEPQYQLDTLLSPVSISSRSKKETPSKIKYDINGFHSNDIHETSNASISSSTDVNSVRTTPRKKYSSISNIFGQSSNQQHHEHPNSQPPKRRVLSYEQNQLLNQLQNI